MSKFKDEFAAHPEVNLLYDVDGMPFTLKSEAENFARHSGKKIDEVERSTTEDDDQVDPARMTKDQLKAELDAAGIEYPATAKKADLLDLLVNQEEEPVASSEEE